VPSQNSSSRADELRAYCDVEAAVEIQCVVMLHCPAAVPAIENAIK
jgi:hypothetical protein